MIPLFAKSSALKQALSYPKFGSDSLRILIPGTGYHLQKESKRALEALGHRVHYLEVPQTAAQMVRTLVQALVSFKPDMLLTLNHTGFDAGGTIGQLLDEIRLPVAAWYVDSPEFVLRGQPLPAASMSTVFVWERKILPQLRALGIQDVHYLPLGTDATVFRPRGVQVDHALCFVGDSMEDSQKRWNARVAPQHRKLVEKIAQSLGENRSVNWVPMLQEANIEPADAEAADVLAASTWRATGRYRTSLLAHFNEPKLVIFGDSGWQHLVPQASWKGPVNYGEPLSRVYEGSRINLNATSLQMQTAVNQRVFDVPAAGGFLITDAQEDVFEHFAPDTEVVTYACAEELVEKVDYYSRNERARHAVIDGARKRVLNGHTYTHRLQNLLNVMKGRHGSKVISRAASST